MRGFNSRSHTGSDTIAPGAFDGVPVSIHAPTRGATEQALKDALDGKFQFTLPRGERPPIDGEFIGEISFQFTLPRGERPFLGSVNDDEVQFQFTLPRGERRRGQ